ncbi:DgyrCDS1248 [Dimorphilus gyrociliatus]|uniref:Dymeclin n=1 Tax=Dimorphilus gyrociliatus TaxID=2664684 RepID=A0A7I8V6U7_9ANNE|nr:DgyrCDS1248 [Dimorphilus gyrociliatus]
MGATYSSISELSSNKYLLQLSGVEKITADDPFWNQLLSYKFHIPLTRADQRLLEESTSSLCKELAVNNCKTQNVNSLIRVFNRRSDELRESVDTDSVLLWQTYNALFILRSICKYFVENLTEELILSQFGDDESGNLVLDILFSSLIQAIIDIPVLAHTYALQVECINCILILLSLQMFIPVGSKTPELYGFLMKGKSAMHAPLLIKTLLNNIVEKVKCPSFMIQSSDNHGALYRVSASLASGLWNVVTLKFRQTPQNKDEEVVKDTLLANQSSLLLLVLANHCIYLENTENLIGNPYRSALISFTDNRKEGEEESPVSFKMNVSAIVKELCSTIWPNGDHTTLLFYLLLHRNKTIKQYTLQELPVEEVTLPLLRILYDAPNTNSHHVYMALIVLLMLTEDDRFNQSIHEIVLRADKTMNWFKERSLLEISLGSFMVLVIIRTIQYNMTRMRDKYLHTNCLAALANMSSQTRRLHPYASQRLLSLFDLLQKKRTKLVESLRVTPESEQENIVDDLQVIEEVLRMLLEIINSMLSHAMQLNPNLVYTLLYERSSLSALRTHPTFQDIIQNIDTVLAYFLSKIERATSSYGQTLSVPQVLKVIEDGSAQFRKDHLKKFPELKFAYVEEEEPEEFFVPYVWTLIFRFSRLYFCSQRVRLFQLPQQSVESNQD